MAPNRKSIIAFEHSSEELDKLQSKLQPTYLPLTHPDELSQLQQVVHNLPSVTTPEDSYSYWEWPSVMMKPSSSHVLSSENIIANLIRASSNKMNAVTVTPLVAEHDAYWAEGNENVDFYSW
jgi:hypothetical protein